MTTETSKTYSDGYTEHGDGTATATSKSQAYRILPGNDPRVILRATVDGQPVGWPTTSEAAFRAAIEARLLGDAPFEGSIEKAPGGWVAVEVFDVMNAGEGPLPQARRGQVVMPATIQAVRAIRAAARSRGGFGFSTLGGGRHGELGLAQEGGVVVLAG